MFSLVLLCMPKVGKATLKSLFGHFNDLGVLGSVGASADHKTSVIFARVQGGVPGNSPVHVKSTEK